MHRAESGRGRVTLGKVPKSLQLTCSIAMPLQAVAVAAGDVVVCDAAAKLGRRQGSGKRAPRKAAWAPILVLCLLASQPWLWSGPTVKPDLVTRKSALGFTSESNETELTPKRPQTVATADQWERSHQQPPFPTCFQHSGTRYMP